MKGLRASSYLNHVDVGNGTSLLFSGSTLCIDLVPTKYARQLSEGQDLSFLLPEEKEHLLKRGHLTVLTPKRELEEFRKLVHLILEKRTAIDAKHRLAAISFIMTYNCNLSCSYCYQHSLAKKKGVPAMSAEFVDRFFSEYYPQLFPTAPKKLIITLFGGEPLLPSNREAILRVLAYARRRPSIRIHVSTNATTLSEMADLIGPEKGSIQSVQVTLDGDRLLHDKNRIFASGKRTFDGTIAAVRKLIKLKAHISLRVHIHRGKLEAAKKLIDYLEKEKILGHPQVYVYFTPLTTYGCEKNSPSESSLFGQIFQAVASRTNRPPSNLDFMDGFLDMQTKKVLPKVRFCGAGGDNFFIVDPLGDIYGCYEEAGHKERRIGSLAAGKVRFSAVKGMYSRRHLLNLPECMRCSAALFCGGGCPCEARIKKGGMFRAYCHQNKEYISQTLKAFFLRKEVKK